MSATTVTTVGALLPRDLLARVAAGDRELAGTEPTDYGLAPGERLNDAITRSWNRLQGLWDAFRRAEAELPDRDATATTLTRQRWLLPLLDELGFAGLEVAKGLRVGGKDYPISHRWGSTVPVHLPGARVPIQRITRRVPGAASISPHGLVQEYLNRSRETRWGIVSNGRQLRILRDNASLTRDAYLEFDLEAMFDGEAFSDFVLLWLCAHRTRFDGDPADKCLLEQWSAEAAAAGTRALDRLRDGVEAAIATLGEGFVAHPDNAALRDALRDALRTDDLERQVLRVVYRMLFLLVAESRDLLLDPQADPTTRERYRRYYSMARVRDLASRRRGSPHDDLWRSLQVTMQALGAHGAPALGLTPLGSLLWSPTTIPDLADAQVDNHHLLDAVRHLAYTRDDEARALRQVDYRNLGAEELGSVYEALLELHAVVDPDARTFALDTAAGNERKTTGSYYTPTALIDALLDTALDPVLDEAEAADDPEAALLALRILDPAVGSGHFLLAAAHRIADRLATARAGGTEPEPGERRRALREVVARCCYGVDVNPMAVELCKVGLWLEATEPGRPLSFLDHRIACGNSLLGTTPRLVAAGVPDDAFKALDGDDREHVTKLRRANKTERTRHRDQGVLDLDGGLAGRVGTLAREVAAIDAIGDDRVDDVAEKERRFAALVGSDAATRARDVADAWCAVFVAPKVPDAPILTDAVVRDFLDAPERVPADVRAMVADLADRYRFLHLHVVFPDVFSVPDDPDDASKARTGWSGGFDVVLGNPPWDKVEFQEQPWFATRDPNIAALPGSQRKQAIERLAVEHPPLYAEYRRARHEADAFRHLLSASGRFPLCGRGRVNTYAVFAELMRDAIAPTGRVGVIVPTGIATDDTTKHFFADLVERAALVSLFDFENRRGIFPGVHRSYKFCLLTLSGDDRPTDEAEFVFFALEVADLEDREKRFTLSPDDFALLNPNTRTCPVFRTRRDAEITKGIYRRVPVLVREGNPVGNPWGVTFRQGLFNMTSDSDLFRARDELEGDGWTLVGNHFVRDDDRYLPLYEAKMIHHFDHRWATYDGGSIRDTTSVEKQDPTFVVQPRYWVPEEQVSKHALGSFVVAFRNITNVTNERTVIMSSVPPAGIGHSVPYLSDCGGPRELTATFCSIPCDWIARQKLGGTNMTFGYVKQFAIPPAIPLEPQACLELTYTAWDLAGFATDLDYYGPPFRWDEERRALLRAELDALMFRLYGIERDDVDYILETFPIVRRKDEERFDEYRTKRLILERFDAMAEADAADRVYESVLDPPPADPSLAHPESTRPSWAPPRKERT